jgi:hypothetical protein
MEAASQDEVKAAIDKAFPDEPYDSTEATKAHICTVERLLNTVADCLRLRGMDHDASKLVKPEKPIFDEYTPKLKDTTYGSLAYKEYLLCMQLALDHHYAHNRHHPEHFKNGISGMNLLDLVEMFCDWYAASQRHADGNIITSIRLNAERFGYSNEGQLAQIFYNTAKLFSANKDTINDEGR